MAPVTTVWRSRPTDADPGRGLGFGGQKARSAGGVHDTSLADPGATKSWLCASMSNHDWLLRTYKARTCGCCVVIVAMSRADYAVRRPDGRVGRSVGMGLGRFPRAFMCFALDDGGMVQDSD
ncbi:hypothetical protein E5D57_002548 [Metarhizium anisopliae]|nr:hypothetical protein E5D57_002548 [Metarhizium anisopliae]